MVPTNRIKPLLPSLREKKRYLVFEIISKVQITDYAKVSEAVMQSCQDFLGILGMAKAGILILPDKYRANKGILRVSHKCVNEVRAALAFVKKINNQDVIVRSCGLSGILKKAQQKFW
jgi:ribonuclease P/MRP protein subunit POP5